MPLPTEFTQVIEDANALMELAIPAFAAQKKVASLEVENSTLKTAAAVREQKLAAAADKASEFFSMCGILKSANRQEFTSRLIENPAEIFDVVQKYAENFSAQQAGGSDGSTVAVESAKLDPIAAFCMK